MNLHKTVEILQNVEQTDLDYIGHSLSILAQFAQEKLPVSQGFIITTLGYHAFLDLSDLKKYFENSRKSDDTHYKSLQRAFDVAEIPHELEELIKESYTRISGFTEAYVNLRALVLDRHAKEIQHRSFVIFDTRGEEKLFKSLKTIYKNIIFDNPKIVDKFFNGELQVVVLVQKAQQSEASGVLFTTDVITKDENKLIIEAVYGLETLVNFDATVPDQYVYDKQRQEIVEKHISKQEFMIVRQGGNASAIEKVPISETWQKRQKIDDKHIITIARTGKIIEEGIGEPQQVIWSYEGGKIWINFIESSKKLSLESGTKTTLQQMVDEQVIAFDGQQADGIDVNFHIPKEVSENKDIIFDFKLVNKKDVKRFKWWKKNK